MNIFDQEPPEQKEKRFITYEKKKYCCLYCGNGDDNPSEVFSKGACNSCGGPGGTVEKITTIERIDDAQNKVLIINAIDTKADSEQVIQMIEKAGYQTVIFSDLVPNGASREQKYQLAEEASRASGMVFIFPSKELSMKDGRMANEAFHGAQDYIPEGNVKVVALLSDRTSAAHLPRDMGGLACFTMRDEARQGLRDANVRTFAIDVDRVVPTLKLGFSQKEMGG